MASRPEGPSRSGPAAWVTTYHELGARPRAACSPAELEQLAVASYLIGDDATCAEAWEGAHRGHLDLERRADAARCSFWLAFCLMMRGQMAQAGAWLGRTETVIGTDVACAARGYLLIPTLLQALDAGDPGRAGELAATAGVIAAEFGDADLGVFAGLGAGQSLMAQGSFAAGTARFDEVMLAVATGEVGPITSGVAYCAVILECMQIFDLRRAAEWTGALQTWCNDQPELVPYRGQCLVHRSQLQQAGGAWDEAIASIRAACRRLTEPPHPALGLAHYQEAELDRLTGAFEAAAAGYTRASASGHEPMPGLALLALARGDVDTAAAGIRRALQEDSPTSRPMLLAAAVEILRDAKDLAAARVAADELAEFSRAASSEVLDAMARQAIGTITLAEGDPSTALAQLRRARALWTRLHMPYDAARSSVLLGLACVALGDRSSAGLEFDNARTAFEALGARPDLDRLEGLRVRSGAAVGSQTGRAAPNDRGGLSSRELEILAHVARGETNREIAAALSISQHTVGRHLENIFSKLGVTGRAAATAYAYEHELL